jgi:hypothetical protein
MTFQRHLVRSSSSFYRTFNLAMGRSPGFASAATYFRPIQTRFRYGSGAEHLNLHATSNSLAHYAKGTRSPRMGLPLLVSARFQDLFHSPPGVLFTFPSRYWFAIGHRRVFSLSRWSCWIPAEFLVFRGTWDPSWRAVTFAYRPVTVYGAPFQTLRLITAFVTPWLPLGEARTSRDPDSTTPQRLTYYRFGLFPVRSPLLGESRLFSLPPGT